MVHWVHLLLTRAARGVQHALNLPSIRGRVWRSKQEPQRAVAAFIEAGEDGEARVVHPPGTRLAKAAWRQVARRSKGRVTVKPRSAGGGRQPCEPAAEQLEHQQGLAIGRTAARRVSSACGCGPG